MIQNLTMDSSDGREFSCAAPVNVDDVMSTRIDHDAESDREKA
jgi:hypothetical protein